MNAEQTLKRLCALSAPSGFETSAATAAAALLRPWVDEVSINRMGTVVGVRRCGRDNAPKVLLDAHIDEIGFLVTGHEDGFLRLCALGGVDPRMLPNREITVLTEPPISGIVSCLPPHIQTQKEMNRSLPIDELFLDVGLSQEDAKAKIPIGTPAVYHADFLALGREYLCAKALDDRACFAILLDTLKRLKEVALDVDLYVLGSTQEETHSTGAMTAAYAIAPEVCVAVDVTHGKTPDAGKENTFTLGAGPVIGVGPNCTTWLSKRMQNQARGLDMPVQIEVMAGHSGTNGWPLQISREGVATAVLSLPLRYMHTPVEVVHRKDLSDTAALLAAFITNLGAEVQRNA